MPFFRPAGSKSGPNPVKILSKSGQNPAKILSKSGFLSPFKALFRVLLKDPGSLLKDPGVLLKGLKKVLKNQDFDMILA